MKDGLPLLPVNRARMGQRTWAVHQQHLLQSPKAKPSVSDGAVGAESLTEGLIPREENGREAGREGGEAESTDSTVTDTEQRSGRHPFYLAAA